MRTYRSDPRWIRARFNSKCSKCGTPIRKGEQAFYYPRERTIYGGESCACGQEAAGDFEAAAFDEAQYNGSW